MSDLGYDAGTRAKADELADHVEQGGKPPNDSVRDTAANLDGVRELQKLFDDPSLTPEQKAKLRRDIARELRAQPEPTGKLPRDIRQARAHDTADPAHAHDPAGTGDGSHEITAAAVPDSSFHGQGKSRARPKINQKAGLKSLKKLASEQGLKLDKVSGSDDTFRVTTPEGETFTVTVKSEPLGGTEVANTVINTRTDEHVIRISDRADDAHVERAMAHELAEIQEVRARARDGRATDPRLVDDALAPGSVPTELSPHDRGRLAELEVLRKQRDAALASGDRVKVAEINGELQALIDHLGLRASAKDADARRALIEDKGDLPDETRALLDELRRPRGEQTPEALGMTPGNGKLVLGDGKSRRVIDLDHIEALVDEVAAHGDPDLLAAAQRLADTAKQRARDKALADGEPWPPPPGSRPPPRLDEFEPLYHVRESLLVQFRNNRTFNDPDPHHAMRDLIKATTERLELIENVANVAWTGDAKDIARTHPERESFYRALDGIVEPHLIDEAWALVIQGVHKQVEINKAGLKGKVPNDYYQQLADKMADLLRPGDRVMPSLWSGGYDVSVYAQNRGFRTLEATQAGRLFDQLKLFKDFSTLGPLWNEISTKFVDAFAGDTHVFVRTMDKNSVLFRQELVALMKLDGITSIKWHVLAGDDLTHLTEIDA
ncbi:MAG TPA: hypothetical protein VFT22_32190, partial [Kofleriaceae bacterium]|nr:hypothetical protein [Kofleriaceae bacterium]